MGRLLQAGPAGQAEADAMLADAEAAVASGSFTDITAHMMKVGRVVFVCSCVYVSVCLCDICTGNSLYAFVCK